MQLTVGLVLNLIKALISESAVGQVVGGIIGGLAGFAWAVATLFVVPVLAFEGLGPRAAFKRSLAVLREKWGEGLVGSASITGLLLLVVILPVALFGLLGAATISDSPGAALIAIAALFLAVALLIGSTLTVVFRVALCRYATEERAVAGFSADDLDSAFRPRRGRRRRARSDESGGWSAPARRARRRRAAGRRSTERPFPAAREPGELGE